MDQQGINADYRNMKDFGDDFALMEFFALNLTHAKTSEGLVEDIQYYRGSGLHNLLVNMDGTHDPEWRVIKEKIDKTVKAKRYLTKAYIDLIKKEPRDKILKGIKETLQINPDDEKAIELYSQIIFEVVDENINQKQFNSALWTIREIISIMPDNPKTLYLLGKTYYHMGLIDQAVAEFEKAVESESEDEEIRCHLGMAYLNKGWIDLSIVQFNRAIRINPDYAEPYLYLGAAYFKKDLIDQAIEEYRNAVSRKADYADVHYNLGIAYLKQGLIDEAIAEWQEVIRIRPNDVNSRYNLAMAYYNHGEIAQSITLLEELLRIKPDFTQASSLLHILYQMRQ
jgi:tetratricopeptide (TPR) repeat protein